MVQNKFYESKSKEVSIYDNWKRILTKRSFKVNSMIIKELAKVVLLVLNKW